MPSPHCCASSVRLATVTCAARRGNHRSCQAKRRRCVREYSPRSFQPPAPSQSSVSRTTGIPRSSGITRPEYPFGLKRCTTSGRASRTAARNAAMIARYPQTRRDRRVDDLHAAIIPHTPGILGVIPRRHDDRHRMPARRERLPHRQGAITHRRLRLHTETAEHNDPQPLCATACGVLCRCGGRDRLKHTPDDTTRGFP